MKIGQKIGFLLSAILLVSGAQAATTSTTGSTSSGQIKVAIVNVQQVLQQSPRVAALSKKLEGEFKDRQTKIGDQQKSLQDEIDQFKKDSTAMNQKDRDAKQKTIADNRADLVKKVVAYQQDLQKEQNKIMQSILGDLNAIVSAIAKNQSYALVLDAQAVIFAADGNDITKDVAKQFNDKN